MSKRDRRVCHVSEGECTAPAGIGVPGLGWADGEGSARCVCFKCGQDVCGKCSKRISVRGIRRRVCNDCIENDL